MIYHILEKSDWDASKSEKLYKPESFAADGFIHCSTFEKIEESANRFFKGKSEIAILCIDENKVKAEIIYEDLYDSGFEFPHIYGQLNLNSVFKIVFVKSESSGKFKTGEILK